MQIISTRIFGIMLVFLTLVNFACFSQTVNNDFWSVSDNVFAVEIDEVNNMLYLGGAFIMAGRPVGQGVRMDAQGTILSGLQADDGIRQVISDGNDGWFVCGDFTRLNGLDRTYIAHIMADGSINPNWQVDCEFSIRSMHLAQGKLFVRGSFATIGGESRPRIAALDPATAAVLSWNPASVNASGSFSVLASYGDTLFATTLSTTISGNTYNRLVALSISTGQPLDWFPEPDHSVDVLLVHRGVLYASGRFSEIYGQPKSGAAAIDLQGDSSSR